MFRTAALLAALALACAPQAPFGSPEARPGMSPWPALVPARVPERPLWSDRDEPTRAEVSEALTLPGALGDSFRTGVAWIEHRSAQPGLYPLGHASPPVAERRVLLDDFHALLSESPFGPVFVLPDDLVRLRIGGQTRIAGLREVASSLGHEVVVVLRTWSQETLEPNPLAATKLLGVLAWLVPGDDVQVRAGAEACALFVATGARLACTQSEHFARVAWVWPWRDDWAFAEARHRALRFALSEAPEFLRRALLDRMAAAR